MNFRIGTILILVILVELIYLLFDNTKVSWFPIANLFGAGFLIPNLTMEYIMYYAGEHLAFCFLGLVIWKETGSEIGKYFFILKALDFVDYMVTYNHVYFTVSFLPVSFNTISCFLFIIVTLRIWIRDLTLTGHL